MPGFKFLGDAIYDIGAALFPEVWTGIEPTSAHTPTLFLPAYREVADRVRDRKRFYEVRYQLRSEQYRALPAEERDKVQTGHWNLEPSTLILRQNKSAMELAKRGHLDVDGDGNVVGYDQPNDTKPILLFPDDISSEEWAEVVAYQRDLFRRENAQIDRWNKLAGEVARALAYGEIEFILKGPNGEKIKGKPEWWSANATTYQWRFALCRMNPIVADQEWTSKKIEDGHYEIYVSQATLDAYLRQQNFACRGAGDESWREHRGASAKDWCVRDDVQKESYFRTVKAYGKRATRTDRCSVLVVMWNEVRPDDSRKASSFEQYLIGAGIT